MRFAVIADDGYEADDFVEDAWYVFYVAVWLLVSRGTWGIKRADPPGLYFIISVILYIPPTRSSRPLRRDQSGIIVSECFTLC